MSIANFNNVAASEPPGPSFREVFATFLKIGLLSFGGPADKSRSCIVSSSRRSGGSTSPGFFRP